MIVPLGFRKSTFPLSLVPSFIHFIHSFIDSNFLPPFSLYNSDVFCAGRVPEDDLKQVAANRAGELHFISFITINPPLPEVPAYLARLRALLPDRRITVMIAGSQLTKLAETEVPPGVLLYPTMKDLVAALPKPR